MAANSSQDRPKRIAIVGGGISGIGCLWGLKNLDYDIYLYEAEPRLGGHANTVMFQGRGLSVPVDTGFIAMNEQNYPEFNRFITSLGVKTIPTDMSFSFSMDRTFEWASTSMSAFVGKASNLLSPWFWRLVFDIARFNLFATGLLVQSIDLVDPLPSAQPFHDEKDLDGGHYREQKLESIDEYLGRNSYSNQFKKYYLIPMIAAPWCIDPDEFMSNFPAATLIQFMSDHGLLDTALRRLQWRTFKNGSQEYVDAFSKALRPNHHVCLDERIKSLNRRKNNEISLVMADGSIENFDHVFLAIHADQALNLLGDNATPMESNILRHFKTSRNVCVVHSDMSLMPTRPSARASWNCLMQSTGPRCSPSQESEHEVISSIRGERPLLTKSSSPQKISVTFDMNRLQGIPGPSEPGSPGRVLVSMNPIHSPRNAQGTYVYDHPLFSSDSIQASRRLHLINGVSNVSFAGAWMGYGFHEDGFTAGLHAARKMINRPGNTNRSSRTELRPWIHTSSLTERFCKVIIQVILSLIKACNSSNGQFSQST